MRTLSLAEIKDRELAILKAFIAICEKEGYYYTLAYGTLIGAIRHKGFIPWDDDIDVFMPRPDYDKFYEKYHNSGIDALQLRGPLNGGQTPFLKIEDTRTHVKCDNLIDGSTANEHLWIDIFPLDGMPKSKIVSCFLTCLLKASYKVAGFFFSKPRQDRSWPRRMFRKFCCLAFSWTNANQVSKLENWVTSRFDMRKSPVIGNFLYGGYEKKRQFFRDPFMSPVAVSFEGLSTIAPSSYDEILRKAYGDYMRLPPEDQRLTHQMTVETEF